MSHEWYLQGPTWGSNRGQKPGTSQDADARSAPLRPVRPSGLWRTPRVLNTSFLEYVKYVTYVPHCDAAPRDLRDPRIPNRGPGFKCRGLGLN